MRKLLAPASLALFTMALTFASCNDNNSEYPDKYVGFASKAQDFTYRKDSPGEEIQVKIIAVDKSKEDRVVYITTPQKPQNGQSSFFKIKESKIMIKEGKKSAKVTIALYPQKIGISNYIQLTCTPQDKKSETSTTTIRLLKKQ